MTDTLPKQELLIKLLRMTASPNDGEALVALRKATNLLDAAGWTWDKLVRGGITVVEDPFNKLEADWTPPISRRDRAPTPPPQNRFTNPPPPKPQSVKYQATPTRPLGSRVNGFPGWCYCCGVECAANQATLFMPNNFNPAAPSKWHVVCTACDTSGIVYDQPTGQRIKKRGKANIQDLI